MTWRRFLPCLFTAVFLALPSQLLAVIADPNPSVATQPDGSEVILREIGDEWYHFTETVDGYVVVQNDGGWWVYADLDDSGRHKASQFRVGKEDRSARDFLDAVGRHLSEDADYISERRSPLSLQAWQDTRERMDKLPREGDAVNVNIPVIMIEYADFAHTQTPNSFDDMMNLAGYSGTGSFRQYYEEISYGNFVVNAHVFPTWFVASNNRSYYKGSTDGLTAPRARSLIREAIDQAEATYSPTWSDFDNDNDGEVDVVIIVHQGRGEEDQWGDQGFIWSHCFVLDYSATDDYSRTFGGIKIDRYTIQPEVNRWGGHIEIGVYCHEFGHGMFFLPDLYDTDGSNGNSEGIGQWGVMGSGSWGGDGISPESPVHMCAWSKTETSWILPTVITSNTIGTSIHQVETNAEAFQLWTNVLPLTEYFLVENRQQVGFDINLPGPGLLIWHIDRDKLTAFHRLSNTVNGDESHKAVDLEAADGFVHLDQEVNRGDAGDPYPGSSVNRFFNDGTNPNSRDYSNAATGVCVDNISNSGPVMTADFCVPAPGVPNLLIRDCALDVGNEPDVQCSGDWVKSLDLWVDNNDDGIIDEPIIGAKNHFYIRAWNIGAPTYDAQVRCWYVNPSLGLRFPWTGTPIINEATGQPWVTIPTPGTLHPTPGGMGHRVFFEWTIPNPPPSIHHYCIGCVVENASDMQVSDVPLDENNLGQINYWALALKKGSTPAKYDKIAPPPTVFREEVAVNNPYEWDSDFWVVVDGLAPGWDVLPGDEILVHLGALEDTSIVFDMISESGEHKDSTPVSFKLYAIPGFELVGALHHELLIDDMPPEMVPGFEVGLFERPGDYWQPPMPSYVLTWHVPTADSGGFPERVRYYEVHASTDPQLLLDPGPATLVEITGNDDDLAKPGYQHHFYAPDSGRYYFSMVAVDLAGNQSPPTPPQTAYSPPFITIEKTHNTYQGHYAFVSITMDGSDFEMGGFDFLIAYDASALTFMEATPGQLLEDCGWEYFTYRYGWQGNCEGPCPSGLLRIVAIADINNGPYHPSCFGPPDTDPHELAEMKFYVTNDRTFECMYVPIRFFWVDCGDNAISSVAGDVLFISDRVYDFEGNEVTGDIHYGGHWWMGDCENPDPDKPDAVPFLNFIHGGVDIICSDSIDLSGDINLNEIPNEIADAVLFTNYFIYGLGVFDINPEGQIAATDVNNDGRVLTVGDLVYLIRIITGDQMPYARLSPFAQNAAVYPLVNHSAIAVSTNSEADIGAGYFEFEHSGYEIGEPYLINGASDMTLKYSNEDGVLKVLVYSMEKDIMISAGAENVFVIPISGAGSIELRETELSDYYGNLLTVTKGSQPILPKSFALHQNYPNPFNASTSIALELPRSAHIKIEVFNIMGQHVTTLFDGIEEAGVHTVEWDGTDKTGDNVASGVYLYRLTGDEFSAEKKMILLK